MTASFPQRWVRVGASAAMWLTHPQAYTDLKHHRDYVPGEQDSGLASTHVVLVLDEESAVPPQSADERAWRAERGGEEQQ